MRNITVSVDDSVYRRARAKAAEQDTSLSSVVRRFLNEFAGGESETDRLKRQERVLRERVGRFRASGRLTREEAHRRGG